MEPPDTATPNAEVAPRGTGTVLAWTVAVLLVAGGLNWGLAGLFGIDLVARLFGDGTPAARVVYAAIGLAGVLGAVLLLQWKHFVARPGLR
ncbi:MAG: DUF378 domain-containing protein [Aquincola tertiaricarbonis]|nr:DUF378 domain-containing protein [Aquincola sp. J276]MCR5868632.1 DUF378 domain-containing protein [Aquincola sp. J276]